MIPKYFIVFVMFFCIFIVSAEEISELDLGLAKQNDPFNLILGCSYSNGSACSSSTVCNVTRILYPNQSYMMRNVPMGTNFVPDFNLTVSDTSVLGVHQGQQMCCDGGSCGPRGFLYQVTVSGTKPDITEGIIYLVLLLINLGLFLLTLLSAAGIEGSNERDDRGRVVGVNYKKYLKMGLFFLAYILLIWLSFNLWNVSENFLTLGFLTLFFKSMTYILISALTPVFLIFAIFIFVQLFVDKRFQALFERGLPGM